jgi:hypothetical protein
MVKEIILMGLKVPWGYLERMLTAKGGIRKELSASLPCGVCLEV